MSQSVTLRLNIPRLDIRLRTEPQPSPAHIERSLEELPYTKARESGERVLSALEKLNRMPVEPALRYRAVESFRPAVDKLVPLLRKHYQGHVLPLADKAQAHLAIAAQLLHSLADGYKIAVTELTEDGRLAPDSAGKLLHPALSRAADYVAQCLLEAYLVYREPPAGTWGELHRLYRYAENHGLLSTHEEDQDPIDLIYKRITLLAFAGPFNLMEGEALTIYHYLGRWAAAASIIRPPPGSSHLGHFFVDLSSESPPRYGTDQTELESRDPRFVDTRTIPDVVMERMRAVGATEGKKETAKPRRLSFNERLERDMFLRLHRAWSGIPERKGQRQPKLGGIAIAAGLSGAHHFISDSAPFNPEQAELALRSSKGGFMASQLSLTPLEDQPVVDVPSGSEQWLEVRASRRSRFDSQDRGHDVWMKIYNVAAQSGEEQAAELGFNAAHWQQKDESPGGLSLFCAGGRCPGARVGELVAYRDSDAADAAWQIGAVRWLRVIDSGALGLGIMRLAETARPLAVRAVQGTGKGGDYFRALLTPHGHPREPDRSLIVPPVIYDIDTVLLLNLGEELIYVRLTDVMEATRSFTQFRYVLDQGL